MNEPWETKQVFVGAWDTDPDHNVGQLGWYLDDGWEPFAVTGSGPAGFAYHLRKRKKVVGTMQEIVDVVALMDV